MWSQLDMFKSNVESKIHSMKQDKTLFQDNYCSKTKLFINEVSSNGERRNGGTYKNVPGPNSNSQDSPEEVNFSFSDLFQIQTGVEAAIMWYHLL